MMGDPKTFRVPLRVVFYRESGAWIAHCLEFDLVGDGDTRDDAAGSLLAAIRLQVAASYEADNPSRLFTPADGQYFAMFAAGRDVALGEFEVGLDAAVDCRIEGVQARLYHQRESPARP